MDSAVPDFSLRGRVALITGAGRGIGLGMAKALAAHGCAVAIQDIEREVAEVEAVGIERAGGRAVGIGGDVTDLSVTGRLVEETVGRLGGLHVLINNAAIQKAGDFLDESAQEIERQVRADFVTPLMLCQRVTPIFRRQRWGQIINLGSIQQKTGNAGMLTYSMCKAAIENMTRALAKELAKDNATVNCVAPGWVDTWRNRGDFKDEADKMEKGRKYIPLGRIGEPKDYGGVAVLLCSEAGGYMTGQTIFVDGGMSVR
jgi:glucose 1-dehydrogenase